MINSVPMPSTNKGASRPVLTLVLLGMLLVALLLIAQWLWLTRTLNPPAVQPLLPAERAPLLSALFRQPAIIGSLIASAVSLGLAVVAAVTPLPWWVLLATLLQPAPGGKPRRRLQWGQEPQSAEAWVADQAALLGVPPTALAPADPAAVPQPSQPAPGASVDPAQPQPAVTPQPTGVAPQGTVVGQPTPLPAGQQPSPGAPPQPQQPGVPGASGQPPALPQPGPSQQPGVPAAPGTAPSTEPGAPQQPAAQSGAAQPPSQPAPGAQPPQPTLQHLLAAEEKVDLKELTDIGDILNSFKDNDEIPAQLLALSQSLPDIALVDLVAHCRRIAAELSAANAMTS